MLTRGHVDVFERTLAGERCLLRFADGGVTGVPARRWFGFGDATAADRELIRGCDGPTVDLGCGPGRLVGALLGRGVSALGVDLSPAAVAVARWRGAPALRRDLFGDIPGQGRWRYAILADGNIGIGGDPVRILERVRTVLGPRGIAIVEFGMPGTGSRVGPARIETATRIGPWFPWAHVALDDADEIGVAAGMRRVSTTIVAGRPIARMVAA